MTNDQETRPWEQVVRGGTRAVILGQVASQLISFLVLAILYRLVSPDQFGLLGMVVPVLLLARIVSAFGLNVAAVQRKHLSAAQLTSLFWLNLGLSLLVAMVTCVCGPLLAWLYAAPAVRDLCVVLSGTLIVTAVGAQHQALLERKLRLGRLTAARIVAQAVGGTAAILTARRGAGVWALVVQQYAELAVISLLVWGMDPWRPGRPRFRQGAADLVRFGGYYSLSSLLFFVAQNADKVLIAYWLGASQAGRAALGMYSQAFNLMMKPVHVVSTPLTGIMLPVLSRVADRRREYAALVARFYRMAGIALLPAGAGLFVVGRDVMAVLGGPAWAPAGWMVTALAPTILVQGFINLAGSVFASSGRPGRLAAGATVNAILLSLGAVAGFHLGRQWTTATWGAALGVAWAYSGVAVLLVFVPYTTFCFRTAQVPLRNVFGPLYGPLLAALLMGILVELLRQILVSAGVASSGRLALAVPLGVALFALLARRDLKWLWAQLTGGASAKLDGTAPMV